ncbi:hypothetical protein JS533_010050, partial [Bifidobacterium amazonense]|nr:hypothetical protein [Bifidobacterium amazonense]
MGYALLAACCTMIAVCLLDDGSRDPAGIGVRARRSVDNDGIVSMPLVLALLTVAVRQGSSIPGALDAVGEAMGGAAGNGLRRAAVSLRSGIGWHHAWLAARAVAEHIADGGDAVGIGSASGGRACDAAEAVGPIGGKGGKG